MSFLTPLTEDCCQVMWANEEKDTCLAEGAAVPQLGKEAGPPPPTFQLGWNSWGCSNSGGLPASSWAPLALTFASISLVELGDGLADLPRAGLVHIRSNGNPAPH